MRRSSVAIPSNIAEGAARNYDKEFVQFLYISSVSLAELETQYLLSVELKFTSKNNLIETCIQKIRKKILGLIKYLNTKNKKL